MKTVSTLEEKGAASPAIARVFTSALLGAFGLPYSCSYFRVHDLYALEAVGDTGTR